MTKNSKRDKEGQELQNFSRSTRKILEDMSRDHTRYQESDVLKSARDSITSIGNLYNSHAMGQLRTATEQIRSLESSPGLNSFRESMNGLDSVFRHLHESPAIKNFLESVNASSDMLKGFHESETMKAYRNSIQSSEKFFKDLEDSPMMKQLREVTASNRSQVLASLSMVANKDFERISTLNAYSAIAEIRNFPFEFEQSVSELDVDFSDIDLLEEIDSEIGEELRGSFNFDQLSSQAKRVLLYVYHAYFLPIIISIAVGMYLDALSDTREELVPLTTPSEVRSFSRNAGQNIDRLLLKGYRVTITDRLNLRITPNIQSEVIETLQIGTLLEVVDKSDRSWLLVEAEIEGESVRGWVARRYTTYFR